MRKFMKTRGAESPPASPASPARATHAPATNTPKTNGHANGVGLPGDEHSSLSRYWSPPAPPAGAPLWEDPQFPATWRSIGDKKLAASVVWLRPNEVSPRPTFHGERLAGHSAPSAPSAPSAADREHREHHGERAEHDEHFVARWSLCAAAGALCDASVCRAAEVLALTPSLLLRVAPPQDARQHYTGAFRFNFWVFGCWVEVCVDDRLPTRDGALLVARSRSPHDFTLPLLEKAYAKLYGGYVSLRGGSVARALQELSGGVVQSFALARQPRALTAQVLHSAVPRSTLLVALRGAGAYCVTGLARVRGAAGAAGAGAEGVLVRVRGAGAAAAARWRGAWARGGAQWRALPDADRDLLARRTADDGDFWMSFSELVCAFSALVLVHVGPDDWVREAALHAKRPWRAVLARRRWRTGYNAGGPPNCKETTGTNPQFHVQVPSGAGAGAHKVHVVVSVTQQYSPGVAVAGARLHAVGFAVYALPPAASPRPHHSLHGLRALDVTHECRAREVVTFFTLPPGQYLVVPHTRRPHTDAAFLLRILTDEQTHVWEVNEDNVIIHDLASEFPDEEGSVSGESRAARPASPALPASPARPAPAPLGRELAAQVDAHGLRAALRGGCRWGRWGRWGRCWARRAPLEVCRALVALRDPRMRGALPAAELPALLALARRWRAVFAAAAAGSDACSSYRLRALLRAAGVCASNKVLECVVVRFATHATISADAYVIALARIYLAHERYRNLDSKLKSNPLSLEEMILMTIYS